MEKTASLSTRSINFNSESANCYLIISWLKNHDSWMPKETNPITSFELKSLCPICSCSFHPTLFSISSLCFRQPCLFIVLHISHRHFYLGAYVCSIPKYTHCSWSGIQVYSLGYHKLHRLFSVVLATLWTIWTWDFYKVLYYYLPFPYVHGLVS